ncbi:MAG: sporulation protein [Dysosmobacter sp.]|mgnify:FL=1|nr:sporulation protein [Dysosmobacter sp.]
MQSNRRANVSLKMSSNACLILCGLLIWFLADAERVRASAAAGLALCGRSVIPALFPFMAVSTMLVSMGFGEWASPRLAGLMNLYRLPGPAGSALLLGLVGGYPIGARTAAELHRKCLLTADEAERLLGFCNNSNPVFLISVLGCGIFGSPRTGVYLWLVHVLSALLAGFFFRGGKPIGQQHLPRPFTCQKISLPAAFVEGVKSACGNMISVCGFVIFFYVLAAPLTSLEGTLGAGLVGFLELFSLTPLLSADRCSFILASACAGWGGISILCQTAAVLEGSGLRLRNCFLGKAAQGFLAGCLAAAVSFYIF